MELIQFVLIAFIIKQKLPTAFSRRQSVTVINSLGVRELNLCAL